MDEARVQFEEAFAPIETFITANNPENAEERAKLFCKLIDFIPNYEKSGNTKKIINKYQPSKGKDSERINKYRGDFKIEGSDAEKLILKYLEKEPPIQLLRMFLECHKCSGLDLKLKRESVKTKVCMYKFIQDHLDDFKRIFEAGSRILFDKKGS